MDFTSTFLSGAERQKLTSLRLLTKKKLQHRPAGSVATKQRGYGLEFDQLRSYEVGDDIRLVDWKASARSTEGLMLKQYLHDHTKSLIIAVDISASMAYRAGRTASFEVARHAALIMASVAHYNKAHCGLLLFDAKVSTYIACSSRAATLQAIVDVLNKAVPTDNTTNFNSLCRYLVNLKKRGSIVIIISDFIGLEDKKALSLASSMYEIKCIRLSYAASIALPARVRLKMQDSETKAQTTLTITSLLNECLSQRIEDQNSIFKQCHVVCGDFLITLYKPTDLIDMMIRFFNTSTTLYS